MSPSPFRSGRRLFVFGLAVGVAVAGCGDEPTGPRLPELEIVVAGGDDQFAALGGELPSPLHAVVRVAATGVPREDVTVAWSVEGGGAEIVGTGVDVSDETGSVSARLRMGETPGAVTVRVAATEQESASTVFTAHAVDRPVLESLSVQDATAGDTIGLLGANFSPTADQNVVRFSGVRGRVVSASSGELRVQVPPCLSQRSVRVDVRLGSLASGDLPLGVRDGGRLRSLDVGAFLDVSDETECVRLPGGSGEAYLGVLQSSSQVGAAQHAFTLVGLVDRGGTATAPPPAGAAPTAVAPNLSAQAAWETRLRIHEADLVRRRPPDEVEEGAQRAAAVAAEVPSLGERRSFRVLNRDGDFDDVTAVAEYVGEEAVLYVDETAPEGGLTAQDLESFSSRFDDVIHPTVADAFGGESDLNANQRVVILFTPTVNRLTERGADGFVGGFFFGLDLLPDREGSNGSEIFYSVVPDPEGAFSDPRTKELVLSVTPAILAHEFQHMVHFNQRMLVLEAEHSEALWLQEGLAQMAEELVARAYASAGDHDSEELFRSGNRIRARRYLEDPSGASLLVVTGQGSLEERGAGWLHTLYLWDRGPDDALGRLTRSVRTGVANVVSVTGVPWDRLLADWWSALFLDGDGPPAFPFEYEKVEVRSLVNAGRPYPLAPEELGATSFVRGASLWSASARYYILEPPSAGSLTLGLGGDRGAAVASSAVLSLRLVRIR